MDFWTQYLTDSLYSPWMVIPPGQAPEALVSTPMAFFYCGELTDAQATMLGKMVAALNFAPGQVTFLPATDENLQRLESQSDSLKVVMFGANLPGVFGEAVHWAGHQLVQTHALDELQSQPDLKRETWSHLKMFAGLQ